jgi:hypothetical protein
MRRPGGSLWLNSFPRPRFAEAVVRTVMVLQRFPVVVRSILTGCASVDEGLCRFSEGRRDAELVQVLRGTDVKRPRFWRCLSEVPKQERLSRPNVIAKPRAHCQPHAPAPVREVLISGGRVHVDVFACKGAIVKRVELKR